MSFSRISVAGGFNEYQSSPVVSVSHQGHQLQSGCRRRQHLHDLFHPLFLPYSPAPPPSCSFCCFGLLSAPAISPDMYTSVGKLKGQGPDQLCLLSSCQLLPICCVELCVKLCLSLSLLKLFACLLLPSLWLLLHTP